MNCGEFRIHHLNKTHSKSHHQMMRDATGLCSWRKYCDGHDDALAIALDCSHPAAQLRPSYYVTTEMNLIENRPIRAKKKDFLVNLSYKFLKLKNPLKILKF